MAACGWGFVLSWRRATDLAGVVNAQNAKRPIDNQRAKGPIDTQSAKGPASTRTAKRAYAPRTAKRAIDTPKPTPKMVEMAAKQTIVEEIVRSAY
jgi:hypothetical protein